MFGVSFFFVWYCGAFFVLLWCHRCELYAQYYQCVGCDVALNHLYNICSTCAADTPESKHSAAAHYSTPRFRSSNEVFPDSSNSGCPTCPSGYCPLCRGVACVCSVASTTTAAAGRSLGQVKCRCHLNFQLRHRWLSPQGWARLRPLASI